MGFTDRAVQLAQKGAASWTRHEALADIRWASFAELPEKHQAVAANPEAAAAAAVAHQVTDGVRMQLLSAKQTLNIATPEEEDELKKLRRTGAGQMREWRDANGFRRMIVLLSATGKLYALHNGDGRLLWTWAPPPGAPQPTVALLWRQPLHHTAQPLVLLLAADTNGQSTDIRWVNQYTGEAVGTATVALPATRVERLPVLDSEHRRVLLLWDAAGGKAAVFPQTAEAAELVAARVRAGLVLAAVNHTEGAAKGFVLRPQGQEEPPADPEEAMLTGAPPPPKPPLVWAAVPVWTTVFPNPIVEAVFPPEEQVKKLSFRPLFCAIMPAISRGWSLPVNLHMHPHLPTPLPTHPTHPTHPSTPGVLHPHQGPRRPLDALQVPLAEPPLRRHHRAAAAGGRGPGGGGPGAGGASDGHRHGPGKTTKTSDSRVLRFRVW